MLGDSVIPLPHIYGARIKGVEVFCPLEPPPPYEAVAADTVTQVRPPKKKTHLNRCCWFLFVMLLCDGPCVLQEAENAPPELSVAPAAPPAAAAFSGRTTSLDISEECHGKMERCHPERDCDQPSLSKGQALLDVGLSNSEFLKAILTILFFFFSFLYPAFCSIIRFGLGKFCPLRLNESEGLLTSCHCGSGCGDAGSGLLR